MPLGLNATRACEGCVGTDDLFTQIKVFGCHGRQRSVRTLKERRAAHFPSRLLEKGSGLKEVSPNLLMLSSFHTKTQTMETGYAIFPQRYYVLRCELGKPKPGDNLGGQN